jgi:hypothetical protein
MTDKTYWLPFDYYLQIQNEVNFTYLLRDIENWKHHKIKYEDQTFRIYNPVLAFFFLANAISVKEDKTNEETQINGQNYFASFAKGYNAGKEYFTEYYKLKPTQLYGCQSEIYIKDIHEQYVHTGWEKIRGWKHVREAHPRNISNKRIAEFGYYSGIVSEVDELTEKYVHLFHNFDKCNVINPEKGHEEIEKGQLNSKIQNNFDSCKIDDIYDYFKSKLVDKKYLNQKDLEQYLINAFTKKDPSLCKFMFSKNPTKTKMYDVFYSYYNNLAGHPHGKQREYAALLGEYFEGYKTSVVSSNFGRNSKR